MINYSNLVHSQHLYLSLGYQNIDVPWWCTKEIADITKPNWLNYENEYRLSLNNKVLIASGEHGFLYLASKGQLASGKYQTITPCFRNEQQDELHQKHFMKLELIHFFNYNVGLQQLDQLLMHMVEDAMKNFKNLNSQGEYRIVINESRSDFDIKELKSYDIELKRNEHFIEIGSYGVRRSYSGTWIYGTGIAEPRFSKIFNYNSKLGADFKLS